MDGSLLGEDLSGPIAAAWVISALFMGGLAAWTIRQYLQAGRKNDD